MSLVLLFGQLLSDISNSTERKNSRDAVSLPGFIPASASREFEINWITTLAVLVVEIDPREIDLITI
jgi:hypothetical protein